MQLEEGSRVSTSTGRPHFWCCSFSPRSQTMWITLRDSALNGVSLFLLAHTAEPSRSVPHLNLSTEPIGNKWEKGNFTAKEV